MDLHKVNHNAFKPTVSEAVKDIVRKNFTKEIEFYQFCRQRLYRQRLALNLWQPNRYIRIYNIHLYITQWCTKFLLIEAPTIVWLPETAAADARSQLSHNIFDYTRKRVKIVTIKAVNVINTLQKKKRKKLFKEFIWNDKNKIYINSLK